MFFFWCGGVNGADFDGSFGSWVEGYLKGRLVRGRKEKMGRNTIVKAQVIRMSSFCTDCPSAGALATWSEISILLLPVANVTLPLSSRSQISFSGL